MAFAVCILFPTSPPALFCDHGFRVSKVLVSCLQGWRAPEAVFILVLCCRHSVLLSLTCCSTTSFSPGFRSAVTLLYGAAFIRACLYGCWLFTGDLVLLSCPMLFFSEASAISHCWRQDAQCGWSNPLRFCPGNQDQSWLTVLWARWLAGLLN